LNSPVCKIGRVTTTGKAHWAALLAVLLLSGSPCTAAADFDAVVAPVLARKCLACHNPTEKKGGLDLSSANATRAGGDSGPAIVSGQPGESLLWERVSQNEMPPRKPLSDEDKQILEKWIKGGATWGTDPIDPFRYSSDLRAGYDWWSLRPIQRPQLPGVAEAKWEHNPIDRFIVAALEARGLKPSPQADKRVLIRRLSFDLLGLPPEPDEVAAFLADESSNAYSRLVDRYLKSPHYGERWGRHWLDIVRFGESQGFERDKLRPNSWPYRDWVIAAINDDLPYDEFVRCQLAGDVIHPDDPRGTIATGFLVAAPWDEVGQTQQSAAMRAVVRQDELEDLIGATAQTFLGLTVNCARCHDHKFDPVTQAEYYRVAAVFAGVKHGERDSLAPGATVQDHVAERRAELTGLERGLLDQLDEIDEPVRQRILAVRQAAGAPTVALPRPVALWNFDTDLRDSIGKLHGTAFGHARLEQGRLVLDGKDSYVATAPLDADLSAKTLEVWLTLANLDQRGGGTISVQSSSGAVFDAIVYGEKEPGKWMAGSNGYARWQSFNSQAELEADRSIVQLAIVYGPDGKVAAYRNGQRHGSAYTAPSLATFEAGKSQVLFGLRHSPPEGDRFLAAAIDRAALYDRALTPEEVAALAGVTSDLVKDGEIQGGLSRDASRQRRALQFELSRIQTELRLLAGTKTYAVAPAVPEATFILSRGNPVQKQAAVGPGAIQALAGLSPELGLAADAPEGQRRRRLASWITDIHNPLTPRVIVNRLWHYHFGTGIVDTPNDLGFNGGRPSHPELLDWLAAELVSPQQQESEIPQIRGLTPPARHARSEMPAPWSLKHLHRLIVTSATYCQSSAFNGPAATVDAGNRLLWRKSPQRLEAEALRDAMLVVAGELNPQMGGPGFQDFRTFTFNSQFYEPVDPVGYEFNRRTVYRTWVRSGRNEFLDVFDCPDPSTTAPKRAVTTTPLQALALLNNSFTLRMAARMAARCEREAPGGLDNQIAFAYDVAFNRRPQMAELDQARHFASRHGLAALCRVIFNSNEFLHVD
jgi:hypothetical protein